ncbi:MAG: hypothetical protein GVY32_00370 [Gammaproteobacteria bacterium]|jgi:hypothetical protein|nr:hypothetical protein [Gammaproteobacteria bacterium]
MKSSRFATDPERRFVLYVPQLESLLREAEGPPGLIDALTRGREPVALDPESPQSELVAGRPLPAAALTRLLDRPGEAAGAWLRADPIGLVPDLAAVWLQADDRFERGDWSRALVELLADEGLRLELTEGGRGYLPLDTTPETRFAPPWALAGRSLEHALPEGPGARRWQRLLNETQVVLHQHRKTAADGAAIPGSLWFWGGGSLPDLSEVAPRVRGLVAADPVLVGLAEWLGLPRRRFGAEVEPAAGLLVEWPARFEDSAGANLERLETFLRQAWRQLRMGRIRQLELAGIETVRRFSVRDAWRFWR